MGCASSTPMIQTTGSEMLKAATHVASDATKTAEDAVEGAKDSVGKTLETAKDSVATTVESVKHEVENVVKEKSEMLEDASNKLMEKLHLKHNENEDSSNKNEEHPETDELKTELDECLKQSKGNDDAGISSSLAESAATKELTRTDTETDSLRTSTPEPEIEQALAKSHDDPQDDDEDNPPTPKPTLSELENLTAEVLKQQPQEATAVMVVNDLAKSNEPLMSAMHENIKTLDSNNMSSLIADNSHTTKDNEPTTTAAAAAIVATNNDIKSNNMHKTPQIPTAVQPKHIQTRSHSQHPPPLLPLTLATTAIATATAAATVQPRATKEKETTKLSQAAVVPPAPTVVLQQHHPPPVKVKKIKVHKIIVRNPSETEEKRPGTTEWEKFADMLAQVRKFNPHDALRRGGTFSKFGGTGPLRERPSHLGHHIRGGMDDDSSDTTSNFRGSPHNSQRSSARAGGRVQRLPNRPNTGNTRRNSNASSTTGRKFDFNPARSRVNELVTTVSSTPLITSSLQTTTNTVLSQIPYAPYHLNNESVKSPANMRSHHSRSDTRTLPPLDAIERASSRSHHQHFRHDYAPTSAFDHNGSSMPLQSDLYESHETSTLTRQSSNTSLFSNNSSYVDTVHAFKSSTLDVNPPHVKNTSSFLTTPRSSPFSIRKSYTDLYFSATSNKENKPHTLPELCSRDKSPYKIRKRCDVCCKKYSIK
ncbi:uncharacterized protein LOC135955352 [Calliphora vicina]|uniref:uncharacterized protein LOC135955352 n=1 Tax=Calliphora vicina TaxID=7373 RepID=UPI00325BE1B2